MRHGTRPCTAGRLQPHIGLLIEQLDGFGVTSVATHFDGTTPHQQDDGAWTTYKVTFPDVPLHTGQYKVSAYLFDSSGMVVYDEWKDCAKLPEWFLIKARRCGA